MLVTQEHDPFKWNHSPIPGAMRSIEPGAHKHRPFEFVGPGLRFANSGIGERAIQSEQSVS